VFVTTKELAETLGVEKRTINETVQRLLSGNVLSHLETKSVRGGNTWVFNEEQATIIKQEIQKHHNLATRQIDGVTTDYEMELMTQKVLAYHAQKAAEYKSRMEIAENALTRIADGRGCYSMNQTAKALKLPYGNIKLYERLRSEGILNADNSPRQEQINAGHFKVVVKHINDKIGNKPVTLTTSKGLVYLARKFDTTIDESVQADAE
jgi:phage antirepressor YoqD-like protein